MPGLECLERGHHGLLRVLGSGFLVDANDLGRLRRIERSDLVFGSQPLATDDQVVLVAQHGTNPFERILHRVLIGAQLEVDERLVAEVTAGGKRKDDGGDLSGGHNPLV